ncbi:MAG: hypothetical protein AAGA48_00320 [Myxococcota bacterium]
MSKEGPQTIKIDGQTITFANLKTYSDGSFNTAELVPHQREQLNEITAAGLSNRIETVMIRVRDDIQEQLGDWNLIADPHLFLVNERVLSFLFEPDLEGWSLPGIYNDFEDHLASEFSPTDLHLDIMNTEGRPQFDVSRTLEPNERVGPALDAFYRQVLSIIEHARRRFQAKPGLTMYFRSGLKHLDQAAISTILAAFEARHPDANIRQAAFENTGKLAKIRLEAGHEDHLAAIAEWLIARPWEPTHPHPANDPTELARMDVDSFFGLKVAERLSFLVNRSDGMELWRKEGNDLILVRRYDTPPNPERELWRFLLHFKPTELERLIAHSVPDARNAVDWSGSREDVAHRVVQALLDRNAITLQFFHVLADARPRLSEDVQFLASLYCFGKA